MNASSEMDQLRSLDRRRVLQGVGCAAAGSLLGCSPAPQDQHPIRKDHPVSLLARHVVPFWGQYQAGILTPAQRHIFLVVLDLDTSRVDEVRDLMRRWTQMAARLTQGMAAFPGSPSDWVPPADTGEADDLHAWGLTLTFGAGAGFFDRMGWGDAMPSPLRAGLPRLARDRLQPSWCGGDLCIQACADDPQVAFHAVHQLVRAGRGQVKLRWGKMGFNAYERQDQTPRNLFGFLDGTANREVLQEPEKWVWIDHPSWLRGGSYMIVRLIRMHLETWDRTALNEQQRVFGRVRSSGAPLSGRHEYDEPDLGALDAGGHPLIPEDAHIGLARRTGFRLLRRSYSYCNGVDPVTGELDVGLLFISFQRDPQQFIAIQSVLGRHDRLNEYIQHFGSAMFVCWPGVGRDQYLGQACWEYLS